MTTNADRPKLDWRKLARGALGTLQLPAAVFGFLALASGNPAWGRMWLLLALLFGLMALNLPVMLWRNPELLAERFQKRTDTKPFDKVFGLLSLLVLGGFFVVAGLDQRLGWTGPLPAWTLALGIALHVLGDGPVLWAMATNRHLETTVRIQTERGPYRYVRHPMYSGMLLMFAGWPLVLGSAWAFLPLGAYAGLLLWRTSREDRTLFAELPGYPQYAAQTRFRLVPHVW